MASEPVSEFTSWVEPDAERLDKVARADDLEDLARHGYEMLEGLRPVGRGLHATEDGRLWRPSLGMPTRHGRDPNVEAFAVNRELEPVWFTRSESPATVAELEAMQAENAKAAERAERERQAKLKALRAEAVPVTWNQYASGASLTLRAAAQRVHDAGGKAEIKDGRLIVSLPPSGLGGLGSALPAAELLYRAEQVVIEHLKAKRQLPDKAVLPSGALAP